MPKQMHDDQQHNAKTSLTQFKDLLGNNTEETFLEEYMLNDIYQIDEESNTKKSEFSMNQKRASSVEMTDYDKKSIISYHELNNYK